MAINENIINYMRKWYLSINNIFAKKSPHISSNGILNVVNKDAVKNRRMKVKSS